MENNKLLSGNDATLSNKVEPKSSDISEKDDTYSCMVIPLMWFPIMVFLMKEFILFRNHLQYTN